MPLHPWDAALEVAEWRDWLTTTDRFGMLAVDDHKPVEHRERVIHHLEQRRRGLDHGAAAQQRRRLDATGDRRRSDD